MKNYLIILALILYGCAAQMAPNGGPLDQTGPSLVDVSHRPSYNIFNSDEKIVFTFDEFIDPLSVVNSIKVFNFDNYTYQVRGKKIILKPDSKWPRYSKIKIKLLRNISDYNGNIMSQTIQYTFFDSNSQNNKKILGKIINEENNLYAVALMYHKDSLDRIIDLTETDINGNFKFDYLEPSQYVAIAVFDSFQNLEDDLKIKKYGFISQEFLDLNNLDSVYTEIKIADPLVRLSIKSFRQINNKFGYALLDNGLEKPYFIPENTEFGDSVYISLNLSNRIEKYNTNQFAHYYQDVIDTIPPKIVDSKHNENEFKIIFDEPISKLDKTPIVYNYIDSILQKIDYSFEDSFTISIKDDIDGDIYIYNVFDNFLNQNKDTLKVYKQKINIEDIVGGNIFGKVKNIYQYPIVVHAKSETSNLSYYQFVDSLGNFSFINIAPGFYSFDIFEIIGDYAPDQYFNGSWNPYKNAARFGYYHKPLEVRSHWDLKDLIIEMK